MKDSLEEESNQRKLSPDELMGLAGTGINGYRAMKEAKENEEEEEELENE